MNHSKTVLLPIAYLPPVQYYSKLTSYDSILVEQFEHFEKQTYRNRCYIYSPNGKLALTVPLTKRSERTITKDIRITNEYNWQKIHWRSLESAYRCSPFFEYYEDDFSIFYLEKKFDFLIDLNEVLAEKINALLKIKPNINKTQKYEKSYDATDDFRKIISPKKDISLDKDFSPKSYKQVFDNKYDFIPNLSIVDLLFNQGPSALDYI